jgi:hypothetical protein
MTEHGFSESVVEEASLTWLESFGYAAENGADIAPEEVRSDALLSDLISDEWAVGVAGRLIGYVV